MKKLTVTMTEKETKQGWIYFAIQMTVLQFLLAAINHALGGHLSGSDLNLFYFLINFICNIIIFHKFVRDNTKIAFEKPKLCLSSAALGFWLYWLSSTVVSFMIMKLCPEFSNANDKAVVGMLHTHPVLISICVVGLVPLTEELVFRGLIFRPLYNRSPWLGYTVSAVCFSLPHVLGYVRTQTPLVLLMSFLQYIPAGLSLSWAYARSQTIWAPVLIHTAVNLISVLVMF